MQSIPDWCVILALVGEGQEIHRGEEAGIQGWKDALNGLSESDEWVVHGPADLAPPSGTPYRFESDELLNLSTTLRSHLA